jgi:hypothetical protein
MSGQLRHEPLNRSPLGDVGQAHCPTSATAGWQQQMWHKKQEKEWEGHLSSLQQCICELLIKNQKLRESLASAAHHRNQGKSL